MAEEQQKQEQIQGVDIAKVLREKGPIVKCVVLRANATNDNKKDGGNDNDNDSKKPAAKDDNNKSTRTVLDQLVEEINMDTTPKKNECEKILGGPFTFVGQYEEEGIMLMARRGWIVMDSEEEEKDDDDNEEDKPPAQLLNPHKLQPPFNETKVYGDILVIKVAEVADPLDEATAANKSEEEKSDSNNDSNTKGISPAASNDEFFLDYTKQEYLKFAARTDVVAPELPQHGEEEEECEDDDDEDEEEVEGESDEEEDEEEAKAAMMQLLMTNVLKQFRERNGRGPSTEELVVLKQTVADKLGMPLPKELSDDKDKEDESSETKEKGEDTTIKGSNNKREKEADKTADEEEPKTKKVKFGGEEDTAPTAEEPKAEAILAQ